MNIEELKLILEALQHTTDGAKDLGVWWVAMHYGEKVFSGLAMVACIWGIAWGVIKGITIASGTGDSERRLAQLRDMMHVGSPGIVTESEFFAMRDKLNDLMRGQNDKRI